MKKSFAKNQVFILAIVLVLVGAALLGTVFACAVQKDAMAASSVEREQAVEIAENSMVMPTPEPTKVPKVNLLMPTPSLTAVLQAQAASENTFTPQGKVEDADTALSIANHAAETLMDMQFLDDAIVEYVPERVDEHHAITACWMVMYATEPSIHAQIDAATGILAYMVCRPMLEDWGTATVEDGEAVISDPALVLTESEKRIAAFRPEETVKESWLSSVTRQEGYIHAHTMVSTDAATYSLDFIQLDGTFKMMNCSQWTGVVEKPESEAEFYDNDADAWLWQLESFDAIELVNPRLFEKADPKDAAIGKDEIERRCKAFYTAATGTEFLGAISTQYYKDLSGEREDYYAIAMKDGSNMLKLALSAKTGDLLDWEGELPVQPILLNGEDTRPLWDWEYDDAEEFTHAYAWVEKTVKALCGEATLASTMVNAVYDDYYMTLNAAMSTGRIHELGFAIKNGKATLQWVNTVYDEDAFYNGYMVPWEADARVIDPTSGEINLGWFGPEKLGAELLP